MVTNYYLQVIQGIKHILWNTSASWSVFPKNPNGLPRTWISASRSNKQSPSGSVFLCQTWLLMTTLCKLGDCFLFKSSEIFEMFVATKCWCWYCCCRNEDFFKQIQLLLRGIWNLSAWMQESSTVLCQRQLRSKGSMRNRNASQIPDGSWGGNHPPHVRKQGKFKKQGKISALNFHGSKKFVRNFALKKSESHLNWTLQTNQDTVRRMSNSPSLLPMSPNVLHFRAVCHTAGSKRNCQNPPTVSVFRGPPQTRTEKLEAKTATNGVRSYESLDVLIQHQW